MFCFVSLFFSDSFVFCWNNFLENCVDNQDIMCRCGYFQKFFILL